MQLAPGARESKDPDDLESDSTTKDFAFPDVRKPASADRVLSYSPYAGNEKKIRKLAARVHDLLKEPFQLSVRANTLVYELLWTISFLCKQC